MNRRGVISLVRRSGRTGHTRRQPLHAAIACMHASSPGLGSRSAPHATPCELRLRLSCAYGWPALTAVLRL